MRGGRGQVFRAAHYRRSWPAWHVGCRRGSSRQVASPKPPSGIHSGTRFRARRPAGRDRRPWLPVAGASSGEDGRPLYRGFSLPYASSAAQSLIAVAFLIAVNVAAALSWAIKRRREHDESERGRGGGGVGRAVAVMRQCERRGPRVEVDVRGVDLEGIAVRHCRPQRGAELRSSAVTLVETAGRSGETVHAAMPRALPIFLKLRPSCWAPLVVSSTGWGVGRRSRPPAGVVRVRGRSLMPRRPSGRSSDRTSSPASRLARCRGQRPRRR